MRIGRWPVWLAMILALNFAPGLAGAASDDFAPRCEISIVNALNKLLQGAPDAVVYEASPRCRGCSVKRS